MNLFGRLVEKLRNFSIYYKCKTKKQDAMGENINDIDTERRDYEYAHSEEISNARVMVTHESSGAPVIRDSETGKVVNTQAEQDNRGTQSKESAMYNAGYADGYAAGFTDGKESVTPTVKEVIKEVPVSETVSSGCTKLVASTTLPTGGFSGAKLFHCMFGDGTSLFCLAENVGKAMACVSNEHSIEDMVSFDRVDFLNAIAGE